MKTFKNPKMIKIKNEIVVDKKSLLISLPFSLDIKKFFKEDI